MNRKLVFAFLLMTTFEQVFAQKTIFLWPGSESKKNIEHDISKAGEGLVDGKPLVRLSDVTRPTITLYPAPKNKATGAAVVVCPGGGYSILALDLEGTEVCAWLNSIGVTAILLKYRVPKQPDQPRFQAPLEDAQRAMGLVRANARQWGIDTARIGIMGFSAGGHLSAVLSNNYKNRTYPAIDDADALSCKPAFAMLIYPAYLAVAEDADKLAPELPVDEQTAPTFIVQTEDDPVRVENSLFYYLGLKKANVPAEMHLYAKGGHGYGLRKKGIGLQAWPQRAEEWLTGLGLLTRSGK